MAIDEFINHLKKSGKEKIQESHPDPTKTSIVVSPEEKLKEAGRNLGHWRLGKIMVDKLGRRFHEIAEGGSDQMLIARMLKGILSVSDVVNSRNEAGYLGDFSSYEMPIADIEKDLQSPYSREDMHVASNAVLWIIFHDFDHEPDPGEHKPQNVNGIDEDKIALYDLGHASRFFWVPVTVDLRITFGNMSESNKLCTLHLLKQMKERFSKKGKGIEFLRDILSDMKKRGAGIPEIISSAPATSGDDKLVFFHLVFMDRIDRALGALTDEDSSVRIHNT